MAISELNGVLRQQFRAVIRQILDNKTQTSHCYFVND